MSVRRWRALRKRLHLFKGAIPSALPYSQPVWPSGKAGKQRDLGSNPLRLSFLFKSGSMWTLVLWLCPSQLMKHSNGSRRCPSCYHHSCKMGSDESYHHSCKMGSDESCHHSCKMGSDESPFNVSLSVSGRKQSSRSHSGGDNVAIGIYLPLQPAPYLPPSPSPRP